MPPTNQPEPPGAVAQSWDDLYSVADPENLSWFENEPETLKDVERATSENQSVIDVGGGASTMADHLCRIGYEDITVVDLSQSALDMAAAKSTGPQHNVRRIVADITNFHPRRQFDVWHDRATFHFLTEPAQRAAYRETLDRLVPEGGSVIIGVFAEDGPEMCAGQPVSRYTEEELISEFEGLLEPVFCRKHLPDETSTDTRPYTICRFIKPVTLPKSSTN